MKNIAEDTILHMNTERTAIVTPNKKTKHRSMKREFKGIGN
jgi:hypothetical protein